MTLTDLPLHASKQARTQDTLTSFTCARVQAGRQGSVRKQPTPAADPLLSFAAVLMALSMLKKFLGAQAKAQLRRGVKEFLISKDSSWRIAAQSKRLDALCGSEEEGEEGSGVAFSAHSRACTSATLRGNCVLPVRAALSDLGLDELVERGRREGGGGGAREGLVECSRWD